MFGITPRRKKMSKADKEWTKRTADELEATLQDDIRRELEANEQRLTPLEREQIAKAERMAKFNATYLRRSEAAVDTRNAVSIARTNLLAVMIFVIVLPLATTAFILQKQSSEKIACDQLSKSSIRYLESSGELLPPRCTTR